MFDVKLWWLSWRMFVLIFPMWCSALFSINSGFNLKISVDQDCKENSIVVINILRKRNTFGFIYNSSFFTIWLNSSFPLNFLRPALESCFSGESRFLNSLFSLSGGNLHLPLQLGDLPSLLLSLSSYLPHVFCEAFLQHCHYCHLVLIWLGLYCC